LRDEILHVNRVGPPVGFGMLHVGSNAMMEQRTLYCAGCGLLLPLYAPGNGARTQRWACAGCDTRYDAVLARDASLELINRIRPHRMPFGPIATGQVSKAISELIARIAPKAYSGPEKRTVERFPFVAPVAVILLSDTMAPVGAPFMVLTRNISRSGIALVSTRPVNTEFCAVALPSAGEETIQFVVQVVRCRPLRSFYEIGGRFVTRMVEPDEVDDPRFSSAGDDLSDLIAAG
jgi:hypothetical protein